jgi:hypothetical protein
MNQTIDRFHWVGDGLIALAVIAGILSLFLTTDNVDQRAINVLPD